MTRWILVACLSTLAWSQPLMVDPAEARSAGLKVWQNECSGTVDGLTSWNYGEEFPSLGIGHFIWYPRGYRGPFDESFPKLIEYLRSRHGDVPKWIPTACPWPDRQSFLADYNGPRLKELRRYLAARVGDQTQFMVLRLQEALPKMQAASRQPELVKQRFYTILRTQGGVYALLDYVNFKGEGIKDTERYAGQGWGLLQVLEECDARAFSRNPLAAFSQSAEGVLRRRVRNSPPERGEQRWLEGWTRRVKGYSAN
ncbi:hypothetical protein JST97_30785 [bacterium]|nr:hypothetical protein [bacterium]